jgi:hypothetical protein
MAGNEENDAIKSNLMCELAKSSLSTPLTTNSSTPLSRMLLPTGSSSPKYFLDDEGVKTTEKGSFNMFVLLLLVTGN